MSKEFSCSCLRRECRLVLGDLGKKDLFLEIPKDKAGDLIKTEVIFSRYQERDGGCLRFENYAHEIFHKDELESVIRGKITPKMVKL